MRRLLLPLSAFFKLILRGQTTIILTELSGGQGWVLFSDLPSFSAFTKLLKTQTPAAVVLSIDMVHLHITSLSNRLQYLDGSLSFQTFKEG